MNKARRGGKKKIDDFIKNVMEDQQANQRVENFLLRDIENFPILLNRVENFFLMFGVKPQNFIDFFIIGIPDALPEKCLMKGELTESAFKGIFEIPIFLWLLQDEIQAFYDDPNKALLKIKNLTNKQLGKAGIDLSSHYWLHLMTLENVTAIDIIAHLGLVSTIKALRQKREKRTRKKAQLNSGAVVKNVPVLALPSDKEYGNALGFNQQGKAYIAQIKGQTGIRIEEGKILDISKGRRTISMAEFRELITTEGLSDKDTGLLELVYTLVYERFIQSGYRNMDTTIAIKAEVLLDNPHPNNKDIAGLTKRLEAFGDMVSVIGYGKDFRYHKVLLLHGYDSQTNTFTIATPFVSEFFKRPFQEVIELEKSGRKLQANEIPKTMPKHSRLVKPSLRKRQDKAAAENVVILIRLIEQAGKETPHIKATTLIERNPFLLKKLEETKNQTQILKRAFTNTWTYLKEDTLLQDYYIDIQLPDPQDPAKIPTKKTLENLVFEFPHKGKRRRN